MKQQTSQLPNIQNLLNSFIAPVVLISDNYEILAANQMYRDQYGEFSTTARAKCYEISHRYSQPCDQAGETCPLKNSLESGQPQRVLHLHYTSSGEEHVDVETLPVRNEKGEIKYFLEILHKSHVAEREIEEQKLLGKSLAFTKMLGLIERVSVRDTTVLLLGESGTGKELAAKAVHNNSKHSAGPFVPVDCSGLTETLFESELFGHEKGAFTGAQHRKLGLIEMAHGGTLFLDEVGEIPITLQVKLLRLLETGSFRRVGGIDPLQAEFRLICATHRDLKKMVENGEFRQDLYYRINAFPIPLPSLRERVDDIEQLSIALLNRLDPKHKLHLHKKTLQCLKEYSFPGNIRELRNILERASLLTDGDMILPEHLPDECQTTSSQQKNQYDSFRGKVKSLKEIEQEYLRWATMHHRGDKRSLAEKLGLSERTLYRKLNPKG